MMSSHQQGQTSGEAISRTNPATAITDKAEGEPNPEVGVVPDGGVRAWLTVAGSFCIVFCTFGYQNSYGVFQEYYVLQGYPDEGESNIAWVGSVQLALQFAVAVISGPLFDKGYFRSLITVGTILYVVCLFMVSLCRAFWQVVLAQALGVGIAVGLLYLPAVAILGQYFSTRRALAVGISATGSSIGGICLPIMLNKLIANHGFERAVQYTGILVLVLLILANVLLRTRDVKGGGEGAKPGMAMILSDRRFGLLLIGLFFASLGLFFPLYFLQVFATQHRVEITLIPYLLAIVNAASTPARVVSTLLVPYLGVFNLLAGASLFAGALSFAVFGADTTAGAICVSLFYGLASGSFVACMIPAVMTTAGSHAEIGLRLGVSFFVMALALLASGPINGALLDKHGWSAPIIFSAVVMMVGACFIGSASRVHSALAKERR